MTDNIRIDITLEEKQALAALTKLTKSTETFGNKAKTASSKATTGFQTFAGVVAGNVATKALTALSSGFRSVTDELIDFDASIREISTILPKNVKITESQVDALSELSKQFGTSQAQQARSFYQVISAGITDTSKAFEVLEASNTLALGGLGNTETAILAITKTLNNFGDEAGSATDIADALFTAVKLGQTRIEEFGGELPKVLSIAKSLGLGFKETAAALTTLTNRSENTSIAATELRAALSSVLKNQAVLSKVTDETGKSFDLERLRVDGLSKFLKDLVKTTGNASNLQAALGGRIQSLNAVLKLSSDDFQSLNSNIDDFATANGASQRAADQNAQAIGKRLDRALQTIKVSMGSLLTEAVGPMITGFSLLGKVFDKFKLDPVKIENATTKVKALEVEIASLEQAIAKASQPGAPNTEFVDEWKARLQTTQDQLDIFRENEAQKDIQAAANKKARDDAARLAELERLRLLEEEKALLAADVGLIELEAKSELAKANESIDEANRKLALENLKKFTNEQGKLKKGLTKVETEEAKKQLDIIAKSDKAALALKVKNYEASAGLLNALSGLAALGGKKTFAVTKALALAAIPINTAAAIIKAYADTGPIGATAAGIVGATQFIKVATSKPPSFEQGGIVGGSVPIGSGDNINANVRSGEVILNEAQQDNLASKFSSGGEMIQTNIFMDGAQIMSVISEKIKDGYRLPQVT